MFIFNMNIIVMERFYKKYSQTDLILVIGLSKMELILVQKNSYEIQLFFFKKKIFNTTIWLDQ